MATIEQRKKTAKNAFNSSCDAAVMGNKELLEPLLTELNRHIRMLLD